MLSWPISSRSPIKLALPAPSIFVSLFSKPSLLFFLGNITSIFSSSRSSSLMLPSFLVALVAFYMCFSSRLEYCFSLLESCYVFLIYAGTAFSSWSF